MSSWIHYTRKASEISTWKAELESILHSPNNAFFLYLYLGRDKTVQDVLNKTCVPSHQENEYTEWMWQAAIPIFDMSNAPWDRSMRWGCQFMHNLLAAP